LIVCLAICVGVSQAFQQTGCGSIFYTQPPVAGQTWTIFLPLLYQGSSTYLYYQLYDYDTSQIVDIFNPSHNLGPNTLFMQVEVPNGDKFQFFYDIIRYDPVSNRQLCFSQGSFQFNFNANSFYAQLPFPTYPLEGSLIGTIMPFHSPTYPGGFTHCRFGTPTIYSDNNNGPNYLLVCSVSGSRYYEVDYLSSTNSDNQIVNYSYFNNHVSFGPTNFQQQYNVTLNNVRTINFNTIKTASAYVSYALSMTKLQCQVRGVSGSQQLVKCPGPININKRTNLLIGRFEFHTYNGQQEEGYAQIIVQ